MTTNSTSSTFLQTVSLVLGGIITAAIIAGAALGSAFLFTQQTGVAQRNAAIDTCLATASNTWNTTIQEEDRKTVNNTVTEPNREWYERCLTQKGISVAQ